MASNDHGGQEGPFEFNAPDAESAAQMYRDWAWSMINRDAPAPTQTGGPLPNIEVTTIP